MIIKRRFHFLFCFVCLTLLAKPLLAAPPDSSNSSPGEQSQKAKANFVVIPILFYMPETKWGGGVGGLITFRPARTAPSDRPSSLYFYAVYTQLKQFSTKWEPEFYFKKENYLWPSIIQFERFPDKFWGLGNGTPDEAEEDYTPRILTLETSIQKRILAAQKVYLGVQYKFETYKTLKKEPGKSLAGEEYLGTSAATRSGLGFIVNWDSRDNIFFPRRGNSWKFGLCFYRRFLGSDFNYSSLILDLRKYLPVRATHVLAFQVLFESEKGQVPFRWYAKLGGDSIMRGYYSGRYRDHYLAAFQAEYRMPVWRRFGLVGFAGLGDVASRLGAFDFSQFKPSAGFGIRFKITPQEGTNLRLDFAWGKGSSGFYFTAREAF